MRRQPVSSSNILSIGYEPESQTLEVEFHSGRIYEYYRVPESVYNALMSASSQGSYFYRHIRDRYDWSKIG